MGGRAECLTTGSDTPRVPLVVVRFSEVRVAGIAPSDPACPRGGSRSRGIQAPSGVNCMRQSASDARASEFAPPAREVVAVAVRHGPQPSVPRLESHERKRARPHGRFCVATKPSQGGDAVAPAPQSQPVAPAPRLAALSRRRWRSGLGRGCRPQGQLNNHTTTFQVVRGSDTLALGAAGPNSPPCPLCCNVRDRHQIVGSPASAPSRRGESCREDKRGVRPRRPSTVARLGAYKNSLSRSLSSTL